ncbi:hypothetical protein HOE37_03000 [Candidatus Woesearchaeota archaeon]|jgi:hypothetical protein|nr:hypothetical protein [Candidatus Woesearchaeota archaeon]MBT4110796.1 hypothetical protein [Candidatus Woesearchaeota archaeon]MBT4336692.1 hypothetical protein [Candidatus Woesearchaeota archaeon]MBT4469559.1 hypothetical protein [Candidatus Woesearchaeota archaeon]MBT6743921.1 hypothetical protein [Candidatus Woesearchaeota archaeon]
MTLHFTHNLQEAQSNIQAEGYHEIIVHDKEEPKDYMNSCDIVEKYGNAKHEIVELINQVYNKSFNHHNWINKNLEDEVAYFINEVGSNSLNHSEFKAPHKFHVWFGKQGFIVAVEQLGKGFNAEDVHENKIKSNEGRAFEFFNNCKSKIFFDDSKEAKIVFMEHEI